MVSAIRLDGAAFTVHVSGPCPIGESVVLFVAALWRQVQKSVNARELFFTAAVGRIGVKNPSVGVSIKDAVAGQVFDFGSRRRRGLRIVENPAGGNLFGSEGNAEVVVEIILGVPTLRRHTTGRKSVTYTL
jgi:hypothetical protein